MKPSLFSYGNSVLLRNCPASLLLGFLALFATLGCNRQPQATYPVKGTVKWSNGNPATELVRARVELKVVEGPAIRVSPRGVVQADGSFVLQTYQPEDGAPAGKYQAIVIPWAPRDEEQPPPPRLVDPRFQTYATSPLAVTIEPESNEVSLTVERASTR